jgi:hypothetical protein
MAPRAQRLWESSTTLAFKDATFSVQNANPMNPEGYASSLNLCVDRDQGYLAHGRF